MGSAAGSDRLADEMWRDLTRWLGEGSPVGCAFSLREANSGGGGSGGGGRGGSSGGGGGGELVSRLLYIVILDSQWQGSSMFIGQEHPYLAGAP
jgi:hypothetical protein